MKTRTGIWLLLSLCASVAKAQDTTLTYFDNDWEETTSENYKYYGKLFQNSEGIWTKQDFYKNGQIQMIGHYKTKDAKESYGVLAYFNENGDTTSLKDFKSDTIPAYLIQFHDNGNAKVRTYILNEVQHGQTSYYYKNGNLSSTGMFEHGNRVGRWTYYKSDGSYNSAETFLLDFTSTCGYKLKFPNDRWIYMTEKDHGKILKNSSLDNFLRKGVRDNKGGELVFAMYTACLHKVEQPHITASMIGHQYLKNKGVKHKVVTSYKGLTFDFDGTIYEYKDFDFGKNVVGLLFVQKRNNNVMELIFHFDKKVDLETLKDIPDMVSSLDW
ncbi:MAG: antitoxin component YwqK of YwqJK toxin-antitoxin module [Bacteroidia bacterium]|jgi:antitoxin component YwqK of YwqJK toxin-antitoxin module